MLTFIVEFSRFAKVYMIQSRSQAVGWFEKYKAWLERVTSVTVKRLQADQAREYMSLGKRIRKDGMGHTFSTAYSTQSKELEERYNGICLETVVGLA